MRVNVYHAADTTYLINVRDTDALMEEHGLTERETCAMEDELKSVGRYWLGEFYLTRRAGQ